MKQKQVPWAIAALSLLGIAVSGYLTWNSIVTEGGICPLTGFFGCSAILSSVYAKILGIPAALFGMVWFLVALLLTMLLVRNAKGLNLMLAWSLLGLVGVIALAYTEFILVRAFCPYCTSAHILGLAILGLTIKLWKNRRKNT